MIKLGKEYTLPNHLISKVFIRGNKVYYTDEKSRIKNAFHCYPTDKIKDPFIRVSLLKYLFENRTQKKMIGFDLLVYVIAFSYPQYFRSFAASILCSSVWALCC